jgi:hypothetical protein
MAYVNGEWVPDNDPFKNPYTQGGGANPYTASGDISEAANAPTSRGYGNTLPSAVINTNTNIFDPSTAESQGYLTKFRQAADQARYYEDKTDANVVKDPRFAAFVNSGQYTPSAQAYPDAERAGANFGAETQNALAAAQSGASGASRDQYNIPYPGFQFNDPYTKQLEDTVRQEIAALSQPQQNPALDQLLRFIGDRFQTLTTTPGYSPQDLAVLRTQALEPIEQDRAASQQRALQRAAAAGYLPTSGITGLTQAPNGGVESIDMPYDRLRAQAERDLAINAINKRNSDLQQALQLGQIAGVQIPQTQRAEDQQRRSELLNLTSILYDLPARAEQQALAVVNGTEGPKDLFSQSVQAQQAAMQQQQANANLGYQIGQLIAGMAF